MPGFPLRVLLQLLRMLSDKPPQTTSTGRGVAMSGRLSRNIRITFPKSHRPADERDPRKLEAR
jgi:hypothetical protein